MSLRKKIILGILAVLILLIGTTGFIFRNEINAVIDSLRYSPEELEQQMALSDQTIKDAALLVPDYTIRDLTEEEKQGLKDGTLTPEDLVESIVEPVSPSVPPPKVSSEASEPQSKPQLPTDPVPGKEAASEPLRPELNQPQVGDFQKELAALLAEVYVLREEFLLALDDLMAEAKAEYLALPPSERTGPKLTSLAGKYFSRAYSLEAQCDARMKDIIDRMETLLLANGYDLSISQSVMDAYLNEKSLKKSWYLSELKKRGI